MTRPNLGDTRRALLAVRERQRQAARPGGDTVSRAPREGYLPLSSGQQRLWLLDQLAPGQPAYNSPFALRLRTTLDIAALRRALTAVVDRHEVLRTRYPSVRGVPHQVVEPAPDEVPLPVTDLGADATPERVREFAGTVARGGFDLAAGPVLRAALGRVTDDEHVLVVVVHHIASDGWSTDILLRELLAHYLAFRAGERPRLPALPVQVADHAVWQRARLAGDAAAEQLAYWRGHLVDLPDLDFPADRPRPARPSGAGAATDRLLPERLRTELIALARSERVTLLTVSLAAFTALLARYTGQDDIPVGSVFSGRTRPEIEPLIGFFANTLVLRTSAAGDPTVRELLARTNETVLGAHFHQDLPFGTLVDELRPERDPSRNPLFQISFTLQNAGAESAEIGDVRAEQLGLDLGTARFDLAVQLAEVPGSGLRLWAEYSTELFDAVRIERLLDHYERLLGAMVADPAQRLSGLPMLTPTERETLEVARNATDRAFGAPGLLHEMFEAWVDRDPDAPALRFGGEAVSYGELDGRANRLAARLRAAGVGPESVVGVLLERSVDLPAALLGILKAGGAYLPLDPDSPPARWELVLGEGGAAAVVTAKAFADRLPVAVNAVCVDGDDAGAGPAPRPATRVRTENLAYTIFTSGSTGRPKGVQVEHRSIVNFVADIVALFRMGPGDRVLQFANPAFDVSLFDFFGALCSGATLVQAPRSTLLDPDRLTGLMRDERVTVTDLPPAVLGLLDPAGLPALRTLFVGLEAFPGELVNRWNTPGREFHNGYGPTEATVACIDYRCPHQVWDGMPPIGTPMSNYQAYVLDRAGTPVPDGVPGELCVGGVGVARGYAGAPGATAERFVPDPFRAGGGRLYRTGDLVRWRHDGLLEFLGRVDNQVKIRGLRVEPGEIEHALVGHPGIAEAVVVARDTAGGRALVAYLVGDGVPAVAELRSYLSSRLPSYLVPSVIVAMPALPRAASGKLDRARLPDPDATAPAELAPEPPQTPTQQTLADMWGDLLGIERVGIHDGFFDLGANSLHATQLVARIRDAFGVTIDLRDLFTHPTVAGLAELVELAELAAASDDELRELLAGLEEEA